MQYNDLTCKLYALRWVYTNKKTKSHNIYVVILSVSLIKGHLIPNDVWYKTEHHVFPYVRFITTPKTSFDRYKYASVS